MWQYTQRSSIKNRICERKETPPHTRVQDVKYKMGPLTSGIRRLWTWLVFLSSFLHSCTLLIVIRCRIQNIFKGLHKTPHVDLLTHTMLERMSVLKRSLQVQIKPSRWQKLISLNYLLNPYVFILEIWTEALIQVTGFCLDRKTCQMFSDLRVLLLPQAFYRCQFSSVLLKVHALLKGGGIRLGSSENGHRNIWCMTIVCVLLD